MAFRVHKLTNQMYNDVEYILGTDAEAFELGEILTLASGRLTKAGVDSTGTQRYLSLVEQAAEATAVTPLCVRRLRDDDEYFVENDVNLTDANRGDIVTLDAAATGITATTTNGVFEIARVFTLNGQNFVSGYLKRD